MKILRKSVKIFRAECPNCYAYLEYEKQDVKEWYVQCPCCGCRVSHLSNGEPVRESEDTE